MILIRMLPLILACATAFATQNDSAGCKDHPLLTRMPGYWIHSCDHKQFNAYTFFAGKGKGVEVQGEFWRYNYYPQNDLPSKPSDLQILRNFKNAIVAQGGSVVAEDKGRETLKLTRDGKEVWIHVAAEFTGKYFLTIVQQAGMAQDILVDAAALGSGLRSTGHIAIYGIFFDTNRAEVKPESDPSLAEIAKLLKQDPGLKLKVVGHTDLTGFLDANMRLSQARAEAVVQALVSRHGIAASRLKGYGVGPLAPVASNEGEEGRARNRRVELVKEL